MGQNRFDFGGSWTDEKLERVRKYLAAYVIALKHQSFELLYVDAFAGSAAAPVELEEVSGEILFPELREEDAQQFRKGSVRQALEVEPPFQRYILIEKDPHKVQQLKRVKNDYPDRRERIDIVNEDSNTYLGKLCDRMSRRGRVRGVVFLDPFGMQVDWTTIECLAETQKFDVWILFPLGIAVTRMLPKAGPVPEHWARTLDRTFGSDEWQALFYKENPQLTFDGEPNGVRRVATLNEIAAHYNERLRSAFAGVAPNPLPLTNSRRNPLYLLCFACGNPRGCRPALDIATYILGQSGG